MFNRYDITDNRGKLGALATARRLVEQQPGDKPATSSSADRLWDSRRRFPRGQRREAE